MVYGCVIINDTAGVGVVFTTGGRGSGGVVTPGGGGGGAGANGDREGNIVEWYVSPFPW